MADADAQPDDAHEHAKAMALAHTVGAHESLGHALGYLADDHYDPSEDATAGPGDSETAGPNADDADGGERGMARFTARSAQRHAVTGDGAVRSFQSMRGGR